MRTQNKKYVTFGILGTIAAFLIIISDIAGGIGEYNGVFWKQFTGMTPIRLFLLLPCTRYWHLPERLYQPYSAFVYGISLT